MVGTHSSPLPAHAVEGMRDNAVITFCDTAGISARVGVLVVEKIRTWGSSLILYHTNEFLYRGIENLFGVYLLT